MQVPQRIGKYELEEFLGGGMSHVFRARDLLIGGTVAIKVLTEAACRDPESKARFLAEARTARNVAHENIISIYDFGEDEDGRPFMVMEFLCGEDLQQAIRNGRTGNLKARLKIALQLARALRHIHSLKIIHRDIKPQNVHINPAGVVKLMDFGIAKAEGLDLTRTGYMVGTPLYMAPEQVNGEGTTGQVDVYAFGVLLFELMGGQRPSDGESMERIFYRTLNEPLRLDQIRPVAPQKVCDLVARCTAKDPQNRPQGFGPIVSELERMIAAMDGSTVILPAARVPRRAAATRPGWTALWRKWAASLRAWAASASEWAVSRPAWAGSHQAWKIPAALLVVLLAAGVDLAIWHGKPNLPPTLSTPTGDMVLVPAGAFQFGQYKEKASLPAFYIDKTEVTNAAYAAFCRASGRPLPDGFPANHLDLPVVYVTIAEAREFARWTGKRLPKPKEWEKAARGTDGRSFPWGNQKDPSRANVGRDALLPANDFPLGASPYQALQMVGNAWEFVDELTEPSPDALSKFSRLKPPPSADEPWCAIRGQSYGETLAESVIWASANVPERWKDRYLGFRCVKDPPSGKR